MVELNDHIRKTIREEIARRGLNDKDIAKKILGITPQAFSNKMTGYRNKSFSLDDVIKLSEYFAVPIRDFFPPHPHHHDFLRMPWIDLVRSICQEEIDKRMPPAEIIK